MGAGGVGEAFAADEPTLDRRVAIEVARPLARPLARQDQRVGDGAAARLCVGEAMAKLHRPNPVVVHDVGCEGHRVVIAMALVEGRTLRQWWTASLRNVGTSRRDDRNDRSIQRSFDDSPAIEFLVIFR